MSGLHSAVANETASATLEFALAAALTFTLIFGAIEVAGAMYTYVVLSDAANQGLRYAVVHSADGANLTANTKTKVKDAASNSVHDMSSLTVSVTAPDGSFTPPNRVTVTLTYPFVPYASGFLTHPPNMKASAEGRMVY